MRPAALPWPLLAGNSDLIKTEPNKNMSLFRPGMPLAVIWYRDVTNDVMSLFGRSDKNVTWSDKKYHFLAFSENQRHFRLFFSPNPFIWIFLWLKSSLLVFMSNLCELWLDQSRNFSILPVINFRPKIRRILRKHGFFCILSRVLIREGSKWRQIWFGMF